MNRELVHSGKSTTIPTRPSRFWPAWRAGLQKDDIVLAGENFASALNADPGSAIALAGSALVNQARGNSEEASKMIGQAFWLKPGSADISFVAGAIALDQGDETNALRYFEDAARANGSFSESAPYYVRTFLRYYSKPDSVPQFIGTGVPALSEQAMQDIIEFLVERERQDLVQQLGWSIP